MNGVIMGELIEESNDKGPYRLARVRFDGDEQDVHLLDFGGIVNAPLKDAQVLLFHVDGQPGKLFGIAMSAPKDRIDGNKPGENRVKNLKTGALIEQTDGKKTTMQDETVVIKSPGGIVHINPPE